MASAAARQLVAEYNAVQQRIRDMQKEFQSASREVFEELAQTILEKYPIIQSFGWRQYTPYFNDGEACVFTAQTDCPFIRFGGETLDENVDLDYDDEFSEYSYTIGYGADKRVRANLTDTQKQEYEAGNAVITFLQTFNEEQYKAMFDDHVKVTVNRDGIDVEEYEHE